MAEPREYTIKSWQPWLDKMSGQPITDPHGNFKGTLLFEEDSSEPIDGTFKKMPAVGDKKFGTVDFYTTKAGAMRKGFKRADRPEQGGGYSGATHSNPQPKYGQKSDDQQESIARSVALKAAVDYYGVAESNVEHVLKTADKFLAWLQGGGSQGESVSQTATNEAQSPASAAQGSGIEHARAIAQKIKDRQEDEEIQSLFQQGQQLDTEFIPEEYR